MCGGNVLAALALGYGLGPSPRVRGKRASTVRNRHQSRPIPACAGETSPNGSSTRLGWVHPRACGGDTVAVDDVGSETGPSPRVRGKPGRRHEACAVGGCIPACEGQRVSELSNFQRAPSSVSVEEDLSGRAQENHAESETPVPTDPAPNKNSEFR